MSCDRARSREADWVPALADIGSLFALFLKRQRAEADLQRFARYDSLTGLPNRSFFLDTLDRTLSRAGRQRTRSALVFIDLDGFKAVNDGLGHAAGDTVLQTMAERLRAGTRSSDLVARIGGDEFTVLVQNLARADDAALVARGLLDRLARPCRADDHDVTLSASAGISVYPEDGTDADTLLRNADLAMYRSKQEGKNTYRFFTAEMSERALERMLLLDSLRVALERDEFEIVYLPVLHREGPPSLEALLQVAASQARAGDAGRVHRPGRGERAHPADRRRGPARGDPLRGLARPEGRSRRRQPLGPAVPPAEPGRHRPASRRGRAASSPRGSSWTSPSPP